MSQPLEDLPRSSDISDYESAIERLRIYFDETRDHEERLRLAYPIAGGAVYPKRTWVDDARDVVKHIIKQPS